MLSLLVAPNAILYLMANAVAIKQHQWKWLMLAIILIGPVVVAPAIPYPAVKLQLLSGMESFPPVILSMGLVWFLSGAATLISFIRHNPLPPTEAA